VALGPRCSRILTPPLILPAPLPLPPQSADLLKATLKYLGERVLFIATTPPLPPRAGAAAVSRRAPRRNSGPRAAAMRRKSSQLASRGATRTRQHSGSGSGGACHVRERAHVSVRRAQRLRGMLLRAMTAALC
jgi:hypothetical protein